MRATTFVQVSSDPELIARPFYFTYIDADPKDEDTVWVNNLRLYKSSDGGRTWHDGADAARRQPRHVDQSRQSRDIDPVQRRRRQRHSRRRAELVDPVQSAHCRNVPGGGRRPVPLPVVRRPAGQQHRDSPEPPAVGWGRGRSRSVADAGARVRDRSDQAQARIPEIVYGVCKGEFSRLSLLTGQEKHYWVYPQNRYGHTPADIRYRFQRTSPLEISPYDPGTIYMGSHVVHRTTDEGVTWEMISPDLTANEPDKQVISGEPITRDITGEEVYSTLYAIRESPLEQGVIWTGANDGPVHVTRDAGENWKNVTPANLPPGGRVQNIEPSPHRMGSAYIAVCRYMLNDWQPYIYRTENYGGTWTRLTDGRNGIPADCPVRVVREDPDREGLLYAGTEFGMFISFDNGRNWQSFQLNLPVTPVTDIRVYEGDLVLSTMGRSFWILDDLIPLHQIKRELAASQAQLLRPRPTYRTRYSISIGRANGPEYPPPGARIHYLLAPEIEAPITLDIIDPEGTVIRSFSTDKARGYSRARPRPRSQPAGARGNTRAFPCSAE